MCWKRSIPASAILEFTGVNHVDHIVIGARQNSMLRSLLGSVSAKVAAEAACTVTVVRPPRPAAGARAAGAKRRAGARSRVRCDSFESLDRRWLVAKAPAAFAPGAGALLAPLQACYRAHSGGLGCSAASATARLRTLSSFEACLRCRDDREPVKSPRPRDRGPGRIADEGACDRADRTKHHRAGHRAQCGVASRWCCANAEDGASTRIMAAAVKALVMIVVPSSADADLHAGPTFMARQ